MVEWTDSVKTEYDIDNMTDKNRIAAIRIGQVIITNQFDFDYSSLIRNNLEIRRYPLMQLGTAEEDLAAHQLVPINHDEIALIRDSFYRINHQGDHYLFNYANIKPRYENETNGLRFFDYLVKGNSTRWIIAGGSIIDLILLQNPLNYDIYFTAMVEVINCYNHLITIMTNISYQTFVTMIAITGLVNHVLVTVHLHLQLYPSVGAIASYYDIAAGRAIYYNQKIYLTPESKYCLINRKQYLDPTMVSSHYAYRLAIYGIHRGLPLRIPDHHEPLDPLIIASDLYPTTVPNAANNLGYIMWYHYYHLKYRDSPLRDHSYPSQSELTAGSYLNYLASAPAFNKFRISFGTRYRYEKVADSTVEPQSMDMRGLIATNIMPYSLYTMAYKMMK